MTETISLVIPTYNEAENIYFLLGEVSNIYLRNNYRGEIIVVDDDSPDGTWEVVETFQKQQDVEVKLLRRFNKRGLSSAVLDGFGRAKGTILGVMDADLSHPPEKIPELLNPIMEDNAEFVIGSRYTDGGVIDNWPMRRRIISKTAILLLRPFVHVKDPLSGFFFIRKEVIGGAFLAPRGFKIGLEIIAKGRYSKIIEVPITFKDRRLGRSKLTYRQTSDYLFQLFHLITSDSSNLKRRGISRLERYFHLFLM